MRNEHWIERVLQQLRSNNLERRALCQDPSGGNTGDGGPGILNFASNDYLNLARASSVASSAELCLRHRGAGAGASRLVTGTLPCHETLERRLASYKGYPSALVFGSGYMVNIGIVPALVGRADHVITDRLAHASIIDAAILSRAKVLRFRHNDAGHLAHILKNTPEHGRRLIITESVFSMDGDLAPLKDIADLAERHGAMLMVDEAHATGVFGPFGAGLIRDSGFEAKVNVCMGTLSKALGGYGGFACCSETMRQFLVNRARSFIFSTAIPPAAAGAAIGALDAIEAHPEWGVELLRRASLFRKRLEHAGLNTGDSASQIVPIIVGDNRKVLSLSAKLGDCGILAAAIRPPTVPAGTARLRLSVTLSHSEKDLERASDVIIKKAREERII